MTNDSGPPSRTSTPRSFTAQNATAEDQLKFQTVGLVNLVDFRRRRANIAEQREKDAHDQKFSRLKSIASGAVTPSEGESDSALTPRDGTGEPPPKRKKRARALLSFDDDPEDSETLSTSSGLKSSDQALTPKDTIAHQSRSSSRKLAPNPTALIRPPKSVTKAAVQAETAARDALRREFLAVQEAVKATEIEIPFIFYDGTNIPGGRVKVKKGDYVWVFLEKCRKLGAEIGASGVGPGSSVGVAKSKEESSRAWARVGVDDLICVRGDVIVPQHYEFYYFMANKIPNPSKPDELLFNYLNTALTNSGIEDNLLRIPKNEQFEGHDHDPTLTKVVDWRWYERNKHIYPASLWKEFEQSGDFVKKAQARKDTQGNSFFY